ncbi:hypothetical protein [Nocardia sp. NBC_01388]|uniref:hypothetical protein n=1 Tax=Nocardia sp. NBC_01388 TaxID=2903596 RepID=UPI003252D928
MVRDFVVLPKGVARRHAEVVVYVRSQYSCPPTEDNHVLCMTGMVEGWRNGVNRANRPELTAHAFFHGDIVQVRVPDEAVAGFLPIMEEVISPGAELYDVTFEVFVRSSSRRTVDVDIGGEHSFSSVSLRELHYWVPNLHKYARTPFVIVTRPNDDTSLIQAYRGAVFHNPDDPITYTLEVVRDSGARRYNADPKLDDPALVADLIWDWAEDRWDRLNELRWSKTDSNDRTSLVQSLDD